MASFAALTVVASLFAAPPQSQLAFGPEPRAAAGSSEPAGESEASENADDREAAKRAFDLGLKAVSNAEFDAAVSAFERAYELRPHPVTLFNLALALEKAERQPEAWELFDAVIDVVESDAERREIRRHMRTIANEIAIVEIDADPKWRLCIDGIEMPAGETSNYRLAVEPGPHQLLLDDHEFELEFSAGDRRVLLLDETDALIDGRRRGPLMPAMLGLSIGSGALALGLGIGAAGSSNERTRTGLAAGAATSAGFAVAAGIVALLIETRTIRDPTGKQSTPGRDCPGSDASDRRLDLRLGPTIDRPVQFAETALPMIPVPVPVVQPAFPRPRTIVPPRRETLVRLDQNRPNKDTPN